MDLLLKKLQVKEGPLVVLKAPAGLRDVVEAWRDDVEVRNRLAKGVPSVLAFVRTRKDVATLAPKIVAAVRDDGLVVFAFPKKASPLFSGELARDGGWESLGELGYEPVRQVAIDDDWTALRFRRVDAITALARDPRRTISKAGRVRADSPEVKAWLASIPEERRAQIETVHRTLKAAVPDLPVQVFPMGSKQALGYGIYHYRYASGREGDWPIIGLANNKQYISVYVCAATPDGVYLSEANADRLGKVSVGRSCIRFTKADNVDLEVLAQVAERGAELLAEGHFAM